MPILPFFRRFFSSAPAYDPARPRILAYCAANVGAGPLLRLTRVLGELKARRPEVSLLLVTDAPDPRPAEAIGAAVVRLPRFTFTDSTSSKERPAHLKLTNREFARLRARLVLSAGRGFVPDLIYADTNPHGKRDELLPLLRDARRLRTPAVLLMRDIPAMPEEPFKLRGATADLLHHASLYARLLVAGDPLWFDVAQTYLWPAELQTRLHYAGFVLPPEPPRERSFALEPWPAIDPARPLVVASCGGGWRAEILVPALLAALRALRGEAIEKLRQAQLLIFIGQNADSRDLAAWRAEAQALGGVVIETFSPHFDGALRHADVGLIQAGSTVFQVLESAQPLVLLTRPYKSSEQEERARRAARWPGIRVESTETITPDRAVEWLRWGLLSPRVSRATGFRYDGARAAASELETMLNRRRA